MSFDHVKEIVEVSNVIEANKLLDAGHELLQIVPGWTGDNTPCTLFYLSKPGSSGNQVMPSLTQMIPSVVKPRKR
jgi:hypothetical protein